MKKIILLIIFIFLFNLNYSEKIVTTFKENNLNNFYILEFPNNNLSTNNFLNYFSDVQVIWIEFNTKYDIKKRYVYKDIDEVKNKYIDELNKNNYKVDAINMFVSGIVINKIKVYSNINKINSLNIENMIVNY